MNKESYYLLYKRAKLYFKMDNLVKAEYYIEQCKLKESKYFKAECLHGMIELVKYERLMKAKLEKEDHDGKIGEKERDLKGRIDREEPKISQARDYFNIVLKSENLTKNKEKKAYMGLARCKELEGNLAEAMLNTRKALNINPYDNEIREKLALLYIKTRELRKAIHQYKLILKFDKNNSRIYLEIGTLFIFLNQFMNGQRYLE